MEAVEKQVGLFDDIEDGSPEIQTKFVEYHKENPHIFEWFCRFTLEKLARGAKHVGSKAIVERIRFESPAIATGKFKINNNFTAYYARLFMQKYPQHEGIFELRKAKADREEIYV